MKKAPQVYFTGKVLMTFLDQEVGLYKPLPDHLYLLTGGKSGGEGKISIKLEKLKHLIKQDKNKDYIEDLKIISGKSDPREFIKEIYCKELVLWFNPGGSLEFRIVCGILFIPNKVGIKGTFTLQEFQLEIMNTKNESIFLGKISAAKKELSQYLQQEEDYWGQFSNLGSRVPSTSNQ